MMKECVCAYMGQSVCEVKKERVYDDTESEYVVSTRNKMCVT